MKRRLAAGLCGIALAPSAALAQRPPSPSQGPPKMSLEAAWAWLMARPGVLVAVVVIIALVAFMFISRDNSKKS